MTIQENRRQGSLSDIQEPHETGDDAQTGASQTTPEPHLGQPDDIRRLEEELEQVRSEANAKNTARAYSADWKHFTSWCEEYKLASMPADTKTVAMYLVSLSKRHAAATLTRRLSAITQAHLVAGHASPASLRVPMVGEAMKGLKKKLTTVQKTKDPLMTEDVVKVLGHIPPGLSGDRDRAILLIGFAGAMRRSELARLRVKDIRWVKGEGIIVTIRKSKTDQEGKGRKLVIKYGAPQGGTCPVVALRDWLNRAKIREGAIFREVDRFGRVGSGPLHSNAIGEIVKISVKRVGLDPKLYAGHSLRAGFATQAARNGVSVFDIMKQTGHRSIATVSRYIREGEQFTNSPSGRLGL